MHIHMAFPPDVCLYTDNLENLHEYTQPHQKKVQIKNVIVKFLVLMVHLRYLFRNKLRERCHVLRNTILFALSPNIKLNEQNKND